MAKAANEAATVIQRIFRGYRTRKQLRDQLRRMLVKEMIQNGEDLSDLYSMGLDKYIEEYYFN